MRSFASIDFTAEHLDPHMSEGWHEHTWTVTAWWDSEPWRDGRCIREGLLYIAQTLWTEEDGKRRIRPELWSNEAIAKRFLTLGNIVEVDLMQLDVSRPGFGVRWPE